MDNDTLKQVIFMLAHALKHFPAAGELMLEKLRSDMPAETKIAKIQEDTLKSFCKSLGCISREAKIPLIKALRTTLAWNLVTAKNFIEMYVVFQDK